MKYTLNFTELSKDDAPIAGGKGASLGEMTRAGIPVPGGFVVLADSFDIFLRETDLVQEIDAILDQVNHEAIHTVERSSEDIQALILSRPMPEEMKVEIQEKFAVLGSQYVAVRSSATAEDGADHAWAGQLDSYLNTTEADLIEKVRKCWASLFTPRAIFYRFEKGLHSTKISVAVVVQSMVNSKKSGIAFSVHPVTEDYNQLIIEAGFGLGEAIVSGSVTPDSYVVEKSPRNILDINVSQQGRALYRAEGGGNEWKELEENFGSSQVLDETQIHELSDIIMRIENHYGFPCDIEWAFEDGKFCIVQSRPITTLSRKEIVEATSIDLVKKIDWQADWEGDFPIFPMALGVPAYFSKMNEIFGVSISHFLTIHKGVITTGYLPTKEYEAFGQSVVHLALDAQYLDTWIENFKNSADRVMSLLREGPEVFFQKFQELRNAYDEYGAYQIATKAAYNFLPLSAEEERQKLEGGRKYSETFYHDSTELIEKVAECIAQKHNYSVHEIMSLARKDIELYLRDNFLPSREELLHRWEKSGVLWTSESEIVFSPDEVDHLVSYWDSQIDSENLKGDTAYPGKVSGVCRVIKNFKEASLKEGEILVTGMTDPNFVPLMKIARAIITDSGGLLCHAAIVARELKIPCIIGTKAATKVLKDGDLVEVDADNGVVRILEKKSESIFGSPELRNFDVNDYILSFWVRGVSVFVTDIHLEAYKRLQVLYVIDNGMFKQYFTKKAYEQALDRGLKFYSDKHAFDNYQKGLSSHCDNFKEFFESEIKNQETLSREKVIKFFEYTKKLCGDYAQMNFESTDKAFAQQENNPTIKKNLSGVAKFKDTVRTVMNMVLFEPNGYLNQFFTILGEQFSLSSSLFDNLTQQEILNLFEGKKPDESVVIKRQEAFVESYDLENFYEGRAAESIIQEFKEETSYLDIFHGQVASKGKVVGTVKIIPVDYSNLDRVNIEISKMKEGDILVAETTAPELIVACKKAGAIVTDMGGLMSHAAIVSREFGIPCVVGTKNASKILKDGDLVEVDADNGVVRILEKVEELEIGNYQKLFQWPGEFSHFLSSYFMAIYNKHKAISLHDGNMWQSFLPHTSKEETLKLGLALYSSEQEYEELRKGLTEGFVELTVHFDQVLKKDTLTKEDVKSLFDQALQHYNYYSQTEFFFTDLAYTEMNNVSQIQKNFETFDELKLQGREYLNKIALAPGCYLDKLVEKIAQQLGCDVSALKCHSINEILELFDGKSVSANELVNRNQYFMHGKGSHAEVLTGDTALRKIRGFFEKVTQTTEVKGQVANKGYYQGPARVFRFSLSEINLMDEEIEKMEKGEILIADTTAPEIILACKKAGAIVTNQGGMMSHAAIVARELDIPCVVGTGHITEIVKTGDLIEVDANSGVVRIL